MLIKFCVFLVEVNGFIIGIYNRIVCKKFFYHRNKSIKSKFCKIHVRGLHMYRRHQVLS